MADTTEQPAFDLLGVRVFAHREGNHVTGRVEFPEAFRHTPVPIDYHSRRPSTPPLTKGGTGGSPSDPRAQHRKEVVDAYYEMLSEHADFSKSKVLGGVAKYYNVSPRSIQLWVRKFETGGLAGLADRYSAAPSKVIVCSSAQALDAMRICAWWSFRIGNLACIDHRATHAALDLLNRGFAVADVLATIDRYFSYSCDRTRMPFKAFSKWVRYDFEKWLHRACADAEYLREVTESRGRDPVPLQAPETRQPPRMPGVRTRRRLANNRATRAGIANLGQAAEVIGARDSRLARRSADPTPPPTKGGKGGVLRRPPPSPRPSRPSTTVTVQCSGGPPSATARPARRRSPRCPYGGPQCPRPSAITSRLRPRPGPPTIPGPPPPNSPGVKSTCS